MIDQAFDSGKYITKRKLKILNRSDLNPLKSLVKGQRLTKIEVSKIG